MQLDTSTVALLCVAFVFLALFITALVMSIQFKRAVKKHTNERNIEYLMRRLILSRNEAIEYLKTQPYAAKNHRLLARKVFLSKLAKHQQEHPLTKAYMEDAEIEVLTVGTDIWRTHEFPTFDTRFCEYRVKRI